MKIENKSIFHDNEIKKILDFVMPGLVREVFEYHRAKVKKKKLTLTIKVRTGNGTAGATITMANLEITNRSNESKFNQLNLRVEPNHGK